MNVSLGVLPNFIVLFVRSWLAGLKFIFPWRVENLCNFLNIKQLFLHFSIINKHCNTDLCCEQLTHEDPVVFKEASGDG